MERNEINNLLNKHFENILRNNSCEDLDVQSKESLFLDFNSLEQKVYEANFKLYSLDIKNYNKIIGKFRLKLDFNDFILDEIFTIY